MTPQRCVVVNKYKTGYDIDIQRGTKFGNPYKGMAKIDAVNLYRQHFINMLKEGTVTVDELKSMAGKRLGCTCTGMCHGDIIAHAVNFYNRVETSTLDFLGI